MDNVNANAALSSPTFFIYWALSAVCAAFSIASVAADAESLADFEFVVTVIEFSLVLAMFFLSFWSDGGGGQNYKVQLSN